ncbi:hypothetical protein ES707_06339 [subsurface metagenome]
MLEIKTMPKKEEDEIKATKPEWADEIEIEEAS